MAALGQRGLPHSLAAPNIEADQPAGLSKRFNNQRARPFQNKTRLMFMLVYIRGVCGLHGAGEVVVGC